MSSDFPKSPRAPYKLTGPTRAAAPKAAAPDSRPPVAPVADRIERGAGTGHNGTPATDGSRGPSRADLRLIDSPDGPFAGREGEGSTRTRIAARKGEGSTPSSRPKSPRALYKLTGPTRAAATGLKAPATDSRPPVDKGHNGTPATDGTPAVTDLRPTAPSPRIAGREGEDATPSSTLSWRGKTQPNHRRTT